MPDEETIRGRLMLLDSLRRRLRVQIDQLGRLGSFAPAYVQIEIDDAQAQIKEVKAYLRENHVIVEDMPEDRSAETVQRAPPQVPIPEAGHAVSTDIANVFISYHPADRAWVRSELLPQLDRAGLSYLIDYRDFEVGTPKIVNMERAVERSRHTLIIVTPDWLGSDWNLFQGILASTADPAGVEHKLLPLLLKVAPLPARIAYLEGVDLTDPAERSFQIEKLFRSLSQSRGGSPSSAPA
jgi:hypothetical protein